MIVVDIGNSGLRAARIATATLDRSLLDSSIVDVYRLSWSASIAPPRKAVPEQSAAPNQRWCHVDDVDAYRWLVAQFAPYNDEPWYVASVHRPALEHLHAIRSLHRKDSAFHVLTYADVPMVIDVEIPAKTGIDRLLSAHAARLEAIRLGAGHAPTIVVQAGTAVTVDLVTAEGAYRGGAIMPGLGLSLHFLAAGTDLLPWLSNHSVAAEPMLPGKNTEQAISAGVHASLVGGASHLVERYRKSLQETGSAEAVAIVTGGDGALLYPSIPGPKHFIEHLVLRGVYAIANAKL